MPTHAVALHTNRHQWHGLTFPRWCECVCACVSVSIWRERDRVGIPPVSTEKKLYWKPSRNFEMRRVMCIIYIFSDLSSSSRPCVNIRSYIEQSSNVISILMNKV